MTCATSSVASRSCLASARWPRFRIPEGKAGLAVIRALGQWVLDYPDDGTDAGFPFDRPYLDLYRRGLRACRAAESLLRKPHDDVRGHQGLERLHAIARDPANHLRVLVDAPACEGCGACVSACPTSALTFTDPPPSRLSPGYAPELNPDEFVWAYSGPRGCP